MSRSAPDTGATPSIEWLELFGVTVDPGVPRAEILRKRHDVPAVGVPCANMDQRSNLILWVECGFHSAHTAWSALLPLAAVRPAHEYILLHPIL
jgi:hypothetical protein